MDPGPILVATDLSARADRAVDRAYSLGEQLSRPVLALHVMASDADEDAEECERRLRAVLPETVAKEARTLIGRGDAPENIAAIADEQDAALICAGVARYNSVGDYILGTAIDFLCRHSRRPVLVVKSRPRAPYRTIVFPTDFSECSRRALLKALRLFPQARFRCVHAFHVPYAAWNKDAYVQEELERGAREAMDSFLASCAGEPDDAGRLEGHVAMGNPFTAIKALAKDGGLDLVAFGSHGESGLRHATLGSMANELLNKLPFDSLIIRAED